jgi:nucleotide-binding universal stress UspA family protein
MSEYYNSILVPVDFTKRSENQLLQAYYIGVIFNKPVTIFHALEKQTSWKAEKDSDEKNGDIEQKLKRLASTLHLKYKHLFFYAIREGKPEDVILDFIKEEFISLVVMGKSGKSSIFHDSIGKCTMHVIHQSPCPVLTINHLIKQTFRKILLPLDLNNPVRNKLMAAILFSKQYGAPLKIIHVVTADKRDHVQMYEEKLYQIKKYLTEYNVASSYELIFDVSFSPQIAHRIVEYAELNGCDVIMLMTQREVDWKEMFLGSTASNVIRYSKIPVLSITPSFNLVRII